jgi:hypothetical protein
MERTLKAVAITLLIPIILILDNLGLVILGLIIWKCC